MRYPSLTDFADKAKVGLRAGPAGILLMEDLSETNSTIRHHLRLGLRNLIVLGPAALEVSPDLLDDIHLVVHDTTARNATSSSVNALMPVLDGRWIYYGYNAEYLFYPFCESRSVGEMTTFANEERRDTILTYVIDLYADELAHHPDGVSLQGAHLDRSGYYADARSIGDKVLDRQLNMHGGLRWRFEEHIAPDRRRIDRVGLFRAQKGVALRDDHTFDDPEYNTYSCPWHHNITAAICSFRAAKSLKSNPGSSEEIETFKWHNSTKFAWHSRQLLDLGLMEPGQWF